MCRSQMAREHERVMAAMLCRNGMGQKKAAQQLGKSYQWVRKWVKREREESGFKDGPRSGRPPKNPRGDPKSNY